MWIQNLAEATNYSLSAVWGQRLIDFVPTLFWALVLLVIGLIVAAVLRWIIEKFVNAIKLDSLLKRIGLEMYMEIIPRLRIGIHTGTR